MQNQHCAMYGFPYYEVLRHAAWKNGDTQNWSFDCGLLLDVCRMSAH